jgi:hypothetical protein
VPSVILLVVVGAVVAAGYGRRRWQLRSHGLRSHPQRSWPGPVRVRYNLFCGSRSSIRRDGRRGGCGSVRGRIKSTLALSRCGWQARTTCFCSCAPKTIVRVLGLKQDSNCEDGDIHQGWRCHKYNKVIVLPASLSIIHHRHGTIIIRVFSFLDLFGDITRSGFCTEYPKSPRVI